MMTKLTFLVLLLMPLSLQAADSVTAREPLPPAHPDPLGGAHGGVDPHAALSADQNIKVALQHRAEGRLPEAIAVMQQTLQKYPQHASSHAIMADLLSEKGDHAEALAMIGKAVSLDDSSALFHVSRALMYLPFQRYQEALADLDRAVELEPDMIAARFNRGSLHAQLEQYDLALMDFDRCIAVDPHLPAPYFNRGSVRYSLGMKEQAVSDIEHFIELSDNAAWKQSAQQLLQAWQEKEKQADATP